MSIIPIGENILVEPIKVDEVTAGGIYLPDTARVTPDKGKIISVGDNVKDKEVLAEGTIVLFRKNSGHDVNYHNKDYVLLPTKEGIGIIKGE
jgi:chaperonin GroES